EEKKKNRMPLAVLREIIRHPGETLTGFIQKEVSPRVASIREEAQDRLEKIFRREDGPPAVEGTSGADLLKSSQRALEEWQRRVDEQVKPGVEDVVGALL